MARVAVILAEGFEEVEAMAIIDVLRRASIEVVVAGLTEGPVASARRVRVLPDTTVDAVSADGFDMLVLPGGQPGADNLNADPRVRDLIADFSRRDKITAAICAAPYVLASAGILEGRRATAYPGYQERLGGAHYDETAKVVTDGNVITSKGPGTALCFALALVERLAGREKAAAIKEGMLIGRACD